MKLKFFFCFCSFLSSSFLSIDCSKTTIVYYYDLSKVNGGELSSKALKMFFLEGGHSIKNEIESKTLCKELIKIKGHILKTTPSPYPDDGFYGYCFILYSQDTIYADYQLSFWRYKDYTGAFDNFKVQNIVKRNIK